MGLTRAALCPSFLLFLLGSFLSRALTATADKKMIKYHGLNRNPIRIPGCSAGCKKGNFSSLMIALRMSHICKPAWLTAWNPFTVHYTAECATRTSVKTDPGSKHSVTQFRSDCSLYLKLIRSEFQQCTCTHTVGATADLIHRDQKPAMKFCPWCIWAPMKMDMAVDRGPICLLIRVLH